nr:WAS/WASL-interacting protein family member 2-like [Taeniopygia guttata]
MVAQQQQPPQSPQCPGAMQAARHGSREQGSSSLLSSLLFPSPPLLCGWLSPARLRCPAPASLPCRGLFLRPLCPPARLLAENNLQKDRLIPRSGVGATQSAPEPLMSCAHRAGEELQPEPGAGAAGPGALGGAEPLCPLRTGHVNRGHRRPPPPPRQIPAAPGHRSCSPAPASLRAPRPWQMPPLRWLRAVPTRPCHREGQSPQHKLLPRRSRAPEGLLYSETLGAVHCSISGCHRPASTSCASRTPGPPPAPGHRGSRHGAPRDLGLILTCSLVIWKELSAWKIMRSVLVRENSKYLL